MSNTRRSEMDLAPVILAVLVLVALCAWNFTQFPENLRRLLWIEGLVDSPGEAGRR